MTRMSITLMPRTEKYFNFIIGELRKHGITVSISEFVNYTSWSLQNYLPKDTSLQELSDKDIKDFRIRIEQFRKEMKEDKSNKASS